VNNTIIPVSKFKEIKKKSHTKKEERLQVEVGNYLKARYPDIIFTSDRSGVRLNMGQAKVLKAIVLWIVKFPTCSSSNLAASTKV
jgi:hypothetical protein